MQGKRLLLLMTILLMVPALVNALSLDTAELDPTTPSGNNNFYVSDFDIVTSTSGNATISYDLLNSSGDSVKSGSQTEVSSHTFSVNVGEWEGTYSVNVTAVNSTNSTDNDSKTISNIKIDTIKPEITTIYDDEIVNQTNTTENGTFKIGLQVNGNPLSVTASSVGGSEELDLSNPSGDDWELNVSPSDFSCDSAGTTCNINITATDEAGNTNSETGSIEIIENEQQTEQSAFSVDVSVETDDDSSPVKNSIVPFTIDVDETGIALQSCDYEIRKGVLIVESSIDNTAGSIPEDDFVQESSSILTKKTEIEGIRNGEDYNLSVTCTSDDSDPVTKWVQFDVEDSTSPDVSIDVEEGETNASVSINATEEMRITDLVYRDIEDNYFNVSHTDNYGKNFDFTINGLESGSFYVLKVDYEDRDPDGDGDAEPNSDSETENFQTLGEAENSTENNETNQTNVYDKLQSMNQSMDAEVNQSFSGENFSYGRDWFRAGEEIDVLVTNFDMNLREFIIKVHEDVRNVKLDVTTSTDKPYWIDNHIPSNNSVFEYFRVESENAPDDILNYVKVRFEVSQNWMEEHDMSAEDIVLFRYNPEEEDWDRLPTSLLEEKSLFNQYQALSPGFSLFAVSSVEEEVSGTSNEVQMMAAGGEEEESNVRTKTEENNDKDTAEKKKNAPGTPWYSWLLYVLGFGILSYVIYFVATTFITGEESLKDHTVIKAHMKRLENFVDGALEKGYSKEQVKNKLVDSGWDERLVDFVLGKR